MTELEIEHSDFNDIAAQVGVSLGSAVARQQVLIGEHFIEDENNEMRSSMLDRYLMLLQDLRLASTEEGGKELLSLFRFFYLTQNYEEAAAINRAGGATYGF